MWWTARQVSFEAVALPGQVAFAAVLAIVGATLDVVSVIAFFKARTTINPLRPDRTDALVVEGFYRFSRNPMYLGMLLILAGIAVYLGQPLNLVFLILFVVLINWLQILPEERVLEARFGQSYRDYCMRVRRWL